MIPRVEPRPSRVKRCAGPCGGALNISCFDKDSSRADGHRSVCKTCRAARDAALRRGLPRLRPWQRKFSLLREARSRGISYDKIYRRVLFKGMSPEEAITEVCTSAA